MVSLAITIGAIVPMIAIVSLSAYLYKWEQQHLSAENLAKDYIYTCRKAVYTETHLRDLDEIPLNQLDKLAHTLMNCDDGMLYYRGRCEIDFSKSFCSISALDGYLILRGIENAERPNGFTEI